MAEYHFPRFILQWKIWWIRSTAHGPGGVARVHGGPRCCGQEGTTAPCRCAGARDHWCSPTVVEEDEPDEAVPEGCLLEHERRRRGDTTEAKNGDGLSLVRG
jgi:hypothetical protein